MWRMLKTGVGISIVVGTVLTGVGLLTSSRWQISFLLGLLSVLLGVLVTALNSFNQRLNAIDARQVAVRPLQKLQGLPHIERPLVEIVKAVASTDDMRSPFLKDRTTKEVEQFSRQVVKMADGFFLCSSRDEELDLVKGALTITKDEVRAVASRGVEWWLQPNADIYFGAYADEAQRIAITRIFLIERADLDDELRKVLDRNSKAGIQTYALDLEQVPEVRRRGLVLFDNTLLHRSAPRREGATDPRDVEFTDVPEEIEGAEADFAVLMALTTTRDRQPPAVLYPS